MANTKSAIKNARKSVTRRTRNKSVLTRLKTLSKKVATLRQGDKSVEAKEAAIELTSALDRAAKKGIIHPNAASRKKAQVSGLVFTK